MKAYRRRKKFIQTEAIALKVYDFGDADRIFVFLTPNHGLIKVVAKGIRKPKSKMGGHIDVLSKVNSYISIGENLSNLSQVEMIENYSSIKIDLSLISIGFYLLELAERFSVENDPNNDIYYHLAFTLDQVRNMVNKDLLMRWFELNLLSIAGFLPDLYNCQISGNTLIEGDHLFSSANGGLVEKNFSTGTDNYIHVDKNSIKAMRFLIDNEWSKVKTSNFQIKNLQNIKEVTKKYIQTITQSSIHSEKFLSNVN
ncbi:MAG: DNA repair protein RecO [Chloroflexota bacterium]|nr:DNA repair protein RecO [Chloroflexota bacterium]